MRSRSRDMVYTSARARATATRKLANVIAPRPMNRRVIVSVRVRSLFIERCRLTRITESELRQVLHIRRYIVRRPGLFVGLYARSMSLLVNRWKSSRRRPGRATSL